MGTPISSRGRGNHKTAPKGNPRVDSSVRWYHARRLDFRHCLFSVIRTYVRHGSNPVAPEILIWVLFDPVGALERAGMANSHGRHARVIRCPAAMLKSFARIGAGPVQREVVSDRHGAVLHDKEQGRVQAANRSYR